jgi:alkylated DNA nucleotide flippase Atl1
VRTCRYSDVNALAGLERDARNAGIIVARNVIVAISTVAIARINGSPDGA